MRQALALCAALAAQPAWGLSCALPDPVARFAEAVAAPEAYAVLFGQLRFDPALLTPSGEGNNMVSAPVFAARFDGQRLGTSGFAPTAPMVIGLRQACAVAWCGMVSPETDLLIFAQLDQGSWVVDLHPCPNDALALIDDATLRQIEACHKDPAACR